MLETLHVELSQDQPQSRFRSLLSLIPPLPQPICAMEFAAQFAAQCLRECLWASGLHGTPTDLMRAILLTVQAQFPGNELSQPPCSRTLSSFLRNGTIPRQKSLMWFYLFCFHVKKLQSVYDRILPHHLTSPMSIAATEAISLPHFERCLDQKSLLKAQQILLEVNDPIWIGSQQSNSNDLPDGEPDNLLTDNPLEVEEMQSTDESK